MPAKANASREAKGKESLQEDRKASSPTTQMGPRSGPRKNRFKASDMLLGISSAADTAVDVSVTSCFVFVTTRSGAAAVENTLLLSNDLDLGFLHASALVMLLECNLEVIELSARASHGLRLLPAIIAAAQSRTDLRVELLRLDLFMAVSCDNIEGF